MRAQVRKLESSGGVQMEELVKKHQKETSDLVKEGNRSSHPTARPIRALRGVC